MTSECHCILIVHSSSSHSGKTAICRSLVHDLPFDVYIKLSRHSSHLVTRSLAAGTLPAGAGDTGRLHQSIRSPLLPPLSDILLLDGPRSETDEAVLSAIDTWPPETRFLIEGYCTPLPNRSVTMYVLRCPLSPEMKPDTGIMAARADLVVINRFPACTPPEEAALLALLRDWNPHVNQVSGSAEDSAFIETVEASVLSLLPVLRHA
ncbi:MAG: hypothetical protein ABFD13_03360 [Candidatus Cryosericum sp.]|nr:hypothetical protein [bacterium]